MSKTYSVQKQASDIQSHTIPRTLQSKRSNDWVGKGYTTQQSHRNYEPLEDWEKSAVAGAEQENEEAGWIHRDKLAQIESKEMAEAGIRVRQPRRRTSSRPGSRPSSRSVSRHGSMRNGSRDRYVNGITTDEEPPSTIFRNYEDAMPEIVHPTTEAGEDEHNGHDAGFDHGLEFSADRPIPQYSRSVARPSTSRIPVSRNSPAPVSNGIIERDSPVTQSRHGSNNFNTTPDSSFHERRRRSQSLGYSALRDEAGAARTSTPPVRSRPASAHIQNSPMTYMTPSPASTTAKARTPSSMPSSQKPIGTRVGSQSKPRTSSSSQRYSPSVQRPISSGRAPGPINRPEGEAPWLATMYKPDPRLPPDQQVIPTHAKRMMQEQREGTPDQQNGYYPTFDEQPPLHLDTTNAMGMGSASPMERNNSLQQPAWPLEHRKSDAASGHSGGGVYSLTPTIPQSPQIPHITATQRLPVTRIPDMDEKDEGKKEKGCCCIVM